MPHVWMGYFETIATWKCANRNSKWIDATIDPIFVACKTDSRLKFNSILVTTDGAKISIQYHRN